MRSASIAALLSAALVACGSAGGPEREASSGGDDARGCEWDTARQEVSSAGSRIVLSLPPGFTRQRGLEVYGHACGAAVMVVEASPRLGAEARTAFAAGVAQGALLSARERGLECEELEERALWVCEGDAPMTMVRLLSTEHGAYAALARGPLSRQSARVLLDGTRLDPARTHDGALASQLALPPLRGLSPSPLSIAGAIDLVPPQGDVAPAPLLAWRFVRYASHPAHPDGSAWEDGELGEAAAELAVTTLSLNAADLSTARVAELAPGRIELTFDGEAAGEPVLVYLAILRDTQGAFFAIARAPSASAGTWMAAFRAHAREAQ